MENGIKKGSVLELTVESLAFGAKGVARWKDFVFFVDRGLPGQKVLARVKRIRKNYGETFIQKILEPSPDQIEPPCPYFGTCGGCQLQHYAYESQIKSKTHQVREILERLGGFESVLLLPAKPAEQIYNYRNLRFQTSDG
jgi:23S rRNA (uracil1939-C5)-methyltransferase